MQNPVPVPHIIRAYSMRLHWPQTPPRIRTVSGKRAQVLSFFQLNTLPNGQASVSFPSGRKIIRHPLLVLLLYRKDGFLFSAKKICCVRETFLLHRHSISCYILDVRDKILLTFALFCVSLPAYALVSSIAEFCS